MQPELLRAGRLVEVMSEWHLPIFNLSLCHLGNRYVPRPVRVFKEFAVANDFIDVSDPSHLSGSEVGRPAWHPDRVHKGLLLFPL